MTLSIRLRKTLFSIPAYIVAGLVALYVVAGFFAVPALVKWQIEKQAPEKLGHRISVGEVRFNPLVFKLEIGDAVLSDADGRPMLAFKRLLADFELRSVIDRAWTFSRATLEAPDIHFTLGKEGRHTFSALLDRLRGDTPEDEPGGLPGFTVRRVEIADGRVAYADGQLEEPLVAQIDAMAIEIDDLSSLPGQSARYRLSLRSAAGEILESGGDLTLQPFAAKGTLALKGVKAATLARGLARLVTIEPPAGDIDFSSNYALALGQEGDAAGKAGMRLALDAPKLTMAGLRIEQGSDALALANAVIGAASVSAKAAGNRVDVVIDDAKAELSDAVVQRASTAQASASTANLGAASLQLAFPDGPVEVSGKGIAAALTDAVVHGPADAELLQLGNASLTGGVFSLQERMAAAEKVVIAKGKAATWIDAQGAFNWLSLLRREAAPEPSSSEPASSAAWRLALKSVEVDEFGVDFADRRRTPAAAFGLEAIRARIVGLDTASAAPMQVVLKARAAGGGNIEADGLVRADNGQSDLKIKLSGIALAQAQPYLSDFALLRLASGAMSAEGRLRYGDEAGTGAKLAYGGSARIDRLLLEEIAPKRPFLAWDSVASGDVVLSLAPNRLDIGELKVVRPAGRLIIAEDQTVNLTDVLRKSKKGESPKKDAERAGEQGAAPPADPFPVMIERTVVSGGMLEFADLSLRPQFATRMHDLKGVITGLGSDPKRNARLQLDARVDKYGSAKIRGQIRVSHPAGFTEVDMAFRNLELTAMSPYVVKFAGYKIASGSLSLDLEYRISNGKLRGENKIVLNQAVLGEKVDSPNALDLPLEFALAVLKDADGVIDIGVPVSGDLNDLKFDTGAVIRKAIGNFIGGIISAPFRALAALFGGGGGEELGRIGFEPGSGAIAPPEQQKLAKVARALKARPALMLVVPQTYAAEADGPVLQSLAVRSEIAKGMGIKLTPGEDPGPIDAASPRAQRAVQAAFQKRYAPEVLAVLKDRALAAAGGDAKPAVAPPTFYQGLVDKMIAEEPVPQEVLEMLAASRSEAIVREITTSGGVPAARVMPGKLIKATDASDKAVTLRLELEVSK